MSKESCVFNHKIDCVNPLVRKTCISDYYMVYELKQLKLLNDVIEVFNNEKNIFKLQYYSGQIPSVEHCPLYKILFKEFLEEAKTKKYI